MPAKKTTTPTEAPQPGCYVMVTTEYRGVFAGELVKHDRSLRTVWLRDHQHCVYWSSSTRGFTGLASKGPSAECRISAIVPGVAEFPVVTAILPVTNDAQKAWESAPWN